MAIFVYLFAYGAKDLSHLVVLIIIIRNDKCPNDSRRIMPFVASAVPFWFFAGKYALENSSIIL